MSLILIVDDVAALRDQYAYDLKRLGGFDTLTAGGGSEGLALIESEDVDCVILDLEMPGVDGFEVLATLKRKGNRVPIIVYTGTGSYDRCVRAVKLGAYSFIAKDEPLERVVREVENALAWASLRSEVSRLRRQSGDDSPLIGESRAALAMKAQIDRLAEIPSPVLILGESGSGKELVARRLHEAGGRALRDVRGRQLRRLARHHGRKRTFRSRTRRLHRRRPHPQGRLRKRRAAAPCSWTRSANCPSRPRPSCSACSRMAR